MRRRRGRVAVWACAAVVGAIAVAPAWADDEDDRPTLVVGGQGEVAVEPDQTIVQLGATIQEEEAEAAQQAVNEIMAEVIDRLEDLDIPEKRIQTARLTLQPVYDDRRPREAEGEPRIIGYRAMNVVRVTIDGVEGVGEVIDACVAAGANQLQSVSFSLEDDTAARHRSMRKAVQDAQAKAKVLAEAMGVRLSAVRTVVEGNVQTARYAGQSAMALAGMAMETSARATTVQPGEVRVRANVTVVYLIEDVALGGD